MSKTAKKLLSALLLVLLLIGAALVYFRFAPQGTAGDKEIVFEVTHADGTVRSFDIATDSENLLGALEQESLISGTEGQYGLYVDTVDGETADEALRQWWCFSKDGAMLNTGVEDTMILDGEHYEALISTY